MNGIPEHPSYRIEDYTECEGCPKQQSRSCVFFEHLTIGQSNDQPKVMFVGEAPGRTEMELCRPFVGRSGRLFRNAFVNVVRDFPNPDFIVLITNVVKCRCIGPPDIPIIRHCIGALEKEADLFAPHLIIALGATAFRALTGMGYEHFLGENRKEHFDFRGFPVRITYHPAAALRHTNYKILLYQDLKKYLRELKDGETFSAVQRARTR